MHEVSFFIEASPEDIHDFGVRYGLEKGDKGGLYGFLEDKELERLVKELKDKNIRFTGQTEEIEEE